MQSKEKNILRLKGWSNDMAADRWGVSSRQVSKVMNDPLHPTYQLYNDAAANLPEIKMNYLIRRPHGTEKLSLYQKAPDEKSFRVCNKNNHEIFENENHEQFFDACQKYINESLPNSEIHSINIDNNIFIPRSLYDTPFEPNSSHMTWYLYLTCRDNDESKAMENLKEITERLVKSNITFSDPDGLTIKTPVFIGSDGFLINQSFLKDIPKNLTIKRILSDEEYDTFANKRFDNFLQNNS